MITNNLYKTILHATAIHAITKTKQATLGYNITLQSKPGYKLHQIVSKMNRIPIEKHKNNEIMQIMKLITM